MSALTWPCPEQRLAPRHARKYAHSANAVECHPTSAQSRLWHGLRNNCFCLAHFHLYMTSLMLLCPSSLPFVFLLKISDYCLYIDLSKMSFEIFQNILLYLFVTQIFFPFWSQLHPMRVFRRFLDTLSVFMENFSMKFPCNGNDPFLPGNVGRC